MKKVYLINIFEKETKKYVSTYMQVFNSKKLAEKAIKSFTNPHLTAAVIKVDMIFEEEYI